MPSGIARHCPEERVPGAGHINTTLALRCSLRDSTSWSATPALGAATVAEAARASDSAVVSIPLERYDRLPVGPFAGKTASTR